MSEKVVITNSGVEEEEIGQAGLGRAREGVDVLVRICDFGDPRTRHSRQIAYQPPISLTPLACYMCSIRRPAASKPGQRSDRFTAAATGQ